jgi:hypothetical protein
LPEVAAALIGHVFAPQQLTGELVVEADHVGLDEFLVGLEQRDAVLRDQIELGRNSSDDGQRAACTSESTRDRPSPVQQPT